MKKYLKIAFCAAIILATALCMTSLVSASSDNAITLGEKIDVTTEAFEFLEYTFTPAEDGYYNFTSYGEDADPCIEITDSEGNYLGSADDEEGLHFSLTVELTAGETYYISIYTYVYCSFSFDSCKLSISEIALGETLQLDGSSCSYIFTPEEDGVYSVVMDGNFSAFAQIYDGFFGEFKRSGYAADGVACPMTAGSTYTIATYSDDGEGYSFSMEKVDTPITVDNDASTNYNGYYSFTAETAGFYTFSAAPAEDSPEDEVDVHCVFLKISEYYNESFYEWMPYTTYLEEGDVVYFHTQRISGSRQYDYLVSVDPMETTEITTESTVTFTDDYCYITFTPEETGIYTFSSTGNCFINTKLYMDGELNDPLNVTYGYYEKNFSVSYLMRQGSTYTLEIDLFDCYHDEGVDHNYTVGVNLTNPAYTNGTKIEYSIGDTNRLFYAFTPSTTGIYKFYSNSSNNQIDPYITIFDSRYNYVGSCDDIIESDYDFEVGVELYADVTYYIRIDIGFESYNGIGYGDYIGNFTLYFDENVKNGVVFFCTGYSEPAFIYLQNGEMMCNRWVKSQYGWSYIGEDGFALSHTWMKDSVGYVHLDGFGIMETNTLAWFYEYNPETEDYTEFICYLGANGYMCKNQWKPVEFEIDYEVYSTEWLYFDETGALATDRWVRDSVGWCYVDEEGLCVKNAWKEDSHGWCYLDENGRMATNRWIRDSVGWCYLDSDGYCATSCWKRDSIGWVYLDENGRMVTNKWVRDSVGWCFVGANGYAVTNCWMQDSVGWCYLNANGSMTKNAWVYDGGYWYYLNGNGYMVTGRQVIGGKVYNFNTSGVWVG